VDTALGQALDDKAGHDGQKKVDPQVLGLVPYACHNAPLGGETVAVPRNCEPGQFAYESAFRIKALDPKELIVIEMEIHTRPRGVLFGGERGTSKHGYWWRFHPAASAAGSSESDADLAPGVRFRQTPI
jgi:hypothetical protein